MMTAVQPWRVQMDGVLDGWWTVMSARRWLSHVLGRELLCLFRVPESDNFE